MGRVQYLQSTRLAVECPHFRMQLPRFITPPPTKHLKHQQLRAYMKKRSRKMLSNPMNDTF